MSHKLRAASLLDTFEIDYKLDEVCYHNMQIITEMYEESTVLYLKESLICNLAIEEDVTIQIVLCNF